MDFSLQVIGGGPDTLQLSAIDPSINVGDFIAFLMFRIRARLSATEKAIASGPASTRPKGPLPISVALRYASSRISLLDCDGRLVCDLDGALGGGGEYEAVARRISHDDHLNGSLDSMGPSSTPLLSATVDGTTSVGVAFKGVQCSPFAASNLSKRGWLYFRDLPLCVHVVCKMASSDRPHGGGGPQGSSSRAAIRHSIATKGHCMFDIEREGMLHMTISEVKAIVSARVRIPALDLWIIDPEDPDGELEGDTTMFCYLRTYGHVTLRVVRREGIAVHVRAGARSLTMPRLRSDTTLKEIIMRLSTSFHVNVSTLFFDVSREFPAQYFRDVSRTDNSQVATPQDPIPEDTCLVMLSANGSDAYLCVSPLRAPAALVGSDGRQRHYDAGDSHASSPLPRVTSTTINAMEAVPSSRGTPQLTAKALAQHHAASHYGNSGGLLASGAHTRHIEPSEVPASVTAQVTLRVFPGVSVERALGSDPLVAEGEAFDVVLPEEDIRSFTVEDLKQFILSNILPQAESADLSIVLGRKLLGGSQPLVYSLSEAELALATATLFLVCQYKPSWAS
jgi:hypothetical protein